MPGNVGAACPRHAGVLALDSVTAVGKTHAPHFRAVPPIDGGSMLRLRVLTEATAITLLLLTVLALDALAVLVLAK